MSKQSPGPEQQALIDALQAEYAAVFAYGLVAAFSNPTRSDLVSANTAAHRARRDATIDALTAADVEAPQPQPAYSVPFPVSDPTSAAQLAAQVEADTAVAWRSVIERSQSEHTREVGVTALTEAAVRAANWRAILGVVPPTTAFPGQP
ncbi:ferritin-like domain-containing protein [Rhodococcus sp. TAF43]|uniref:ferritin-like domain-containing protein n=1 Tax=unclassified Rhodococcus (in: high G+C Gram-positive bacteria) TaxID=192944 RepID=UPI001582F7BE|nr:ferritin-like domain-containing protein [Rhodococcus sp. W8901]QKT11181.1 ferritin-like domain-containing protein [Rhodococcus sp. W8901]